MSILQYGHFSLSLPMYFIAEQLYYEYTTSITFQINLVYLFYFNKEFLGERAILKMFKNLNLIRKSRLKSYIYTPVGLYLAERNEFASWLPMSNIMRWLWLTYRQIVFLKHWFNWFKHTIIMLMTQTLYNVLY